MAEMLCTAADASAGDTSDGEAAAGKLAHLALLRGWHTGRASQWAAELAADPMVLAHAVKASRQSQSGSGHGSTDGLATGVPPDEILVQPSHVWEGDTADAGRALLLQTGASHAADPDTHAAASLKLHDQAYLDKDKKPKNAGQAKNKGGEAPGGAGAKMTQDVTALLRDNLAVAAIRYLPAQLVTTGAAAVAESTVNVLTRWIRPRLHSKIHKGVAAKLRLRLSKTLSRAVTTRVVRDTHAALERDLSQGLSRLLPLILAPATADLTNYRPEKDWYCAICKATKGKGDLYCQYCKNPDTGMWNVQVVQAQYYAGFYGSHAAALHPIKVIPASEVKESA
jgi:hypothetical protein